MSYYPFGEKWFEEALKHLKEQKSKSIFGQYFFVDEFCAITPPKYEEMTSLFSVPIVGSGKIFLHQAKIQRHLAAISMQVNWRNQ